MQPIAKYINTQDFSIHLSGGKSAIIKAGEECEYFPHSDTYTFEARDGYVPFLSRSFVESASWLVPAEKVRS